MANRTHTGWLAASLLAVGGVAVGCGEATPTAPSTGVVTNTLAFPESFDVNGNWEGRAFSGDYDEPLTFTVVNGAVVSISCWTSGVVALAPPAPITHGEFLFRDEDGVAISGSILAPNEAAGFVNVGPCVDRGWHATRDSREAGTSSD
jgi:hypothetical protein